MDDFAEDWNESQFWVRFSSLCVFGAIGWDVLYVERGVMLIERWEKYADETAIILAEELLSGVDENTVIAVVSAPSVFVQIRNILVRMPLLLSPYLPVTALSSMAT
jgi:EEF1A lysine methyltransferase 1